MFSICVHLCSSVAIGSQESNVSKGVGFAMFSLMRSIGSPSELERRRLLAVQRVGEGYSPEEAADFLGVAPRSVWRWLADFRLHGAAGLAARPTSGRPPNLTPPQEKIVCRWLTDNPTDHGFPTELWTAGRLALLIAEEWGISFHPHYLTCWLRQRGYTPQLPRRVPRERDDREIARWLVEDWPRIKRKARRRGACLMLLDESGLLMAPLRRRSWSLRGHPSQIKEKAGHREKVSVVGGLWLTPSRDRLHFAFQTLVNDYFSNVEVAEFLSGALQWLTEPLVVLWDRGNMHKGDPISELVAQFPGRLELEPLPAHAPMLNPVEQVWTWLKYGRLCNFPPPDAQRLNEMVIRELEAIREDQERLRNFSHASDLPLPLTLLS
jgi:transposase